MDAVTGAFPHPEDGKPHLRERGRQQSSRWRPRSQPLAPEDAAGDASHTRAAGARESLLCFLLSKSKGASGLMLFPPALFLTLFGGLRSSAIQCRKLCNPEHVQESRGQRQTEREMASFFSHGFTAARRPLAYGYALKNLFMRLFYERKSFKQRGTWLLLLNGNFN